ncbi:MAG: hypothetical protein A2162_07145 [Deltaproteobacteria bacterium RBG_13_52_11b]|nr:MAG: hypothetical protein A2162_07145 [Deltaproteobacteria bacterium RBG_13_52_11b]
MGQVMVTSRELDQEEKTEVSVEHLACVFTEYVPGEDHDLEALLVPTASQPEFVPSPQSKRY